MVRQPPDPASLVDALPEPVRALARRGVLHRVLKGQLLIREGEVGDTIYVIVSGRLRVYNAHATNGREITHGTYGPGEYVGEMGLDGGPRSATVLALETSLVAVIARPTLQAFIAEHPGFAFELLEKVIRRARAATLSARQLALNDVYGRLKDLLESQLEPPGPDGRRRVHETMNQREIAACVGCTREMVTRLLGELEKGGWIERGSGHTIWICRPLPARY